MIRPFFERDREDIRAICLETCFDKYLLEHSDVLYLIYADYYMNEEPNNIFVATNEQDKAVGYILCSPCYKKYVKTFKEKYIPLLANIDPNKANEEEKSLLIHKFFGINYPAHLHIDLSESAQRKGLGTQLMNALLDHLTVNNVKGVYLGCYRRNEKGVNFYTKYGFKRLITTKNSVVFGMKLKNYKNKQ